MIPITINHNRETLLGFLTFKNGRATVKACPGLFFSQEMIFDVFGKCSIGVPHPYDPNQIKEFDILAFNFNPNENGKAMLKIATGDK